jgi:hypothetical protein
MTNVSLKVGKRIIKADAHIARITGDASVSSSYKHLNTGEVISVFERHGFSVAKSWAKGRTVKSKKEFDTSKHIVEMHHEALHEGLGGLKPTVFIVNSHDGSSGLQIKLGFLRLACMNGLVVGHELGSFTVRHAGKKAQMSELEAKLAAIAEKFNEIINVFKSMQTTGINFFQAMRLAKEALVMKYGQDVVDKLDADKLELACCLLLKSNRTADNGTDLFVTFNRIQENMLQFSLSGRKAVVRSEDRRLELTSKLLRESLKMVA